MTQPAIWTSDCLVAASTSRGVGYNEIDDPIKNVLDPYDARHFIPHDRLPTKMVLERAVTRRDATLPDFFRGIDRLCYISTKFHELLSRFELGEIQLHQMPLYENDEVTRRPDPPFYLINILERKPDTVVIGESDLKAFSSRWRPAYGDASYAKFTVNAGTTHGADLWIDPQVIDTPFFSDRLVQAIKAEKIRGLRFFPCKVRGYNA